MIGIIPPQYRLAAAIAGAAALAVASFGAGWAVQGWRLGTEIADLKAEHAEQVRRAAKAERDNLTRVINEERAAREDAERTADAERTRAAAAAAVVADLSGQSDRLRDDIRRYSAARSCAPGATPAVAGRGAAGPAAGVVPGDVRDLMLDEAAEALRVLAPAADTARAKHAACVAIYDAARARLKRLGEAGRTIEGQP